MEIQKQLNQVSLEEASRLISQAVIKERAKLDENIVRLEEMRKKFEKDYIAANDGDSSENAPLDEAKKNLRENMGRIIATMALAEQMDNIELREYILGTYDFSTIDKSYESLIGTDKSTVNNIFHCNSAETLIGVLKENSDEILIKYLELLCNEIESNENSTDEIVAFLNVIVEYIKEKRRPDYNYSGVVTLYSTVRLNYNNEVMTYRIYPETVSFLDIGVLASGSRVATAILGKRKGDKVNIEHNTKRNTLCCEILDIY